MLFFKKIIMLLLLKIVEVFIVLVLPWAIGHCCTNVFKVIISPKITITSTWALGIISIFVLMLALLITLGLIILLLSWINFNWKLINDNKGISWIEDTINILRNFP